MAALRALRVRLLLPLLLCAAAPLPLLSSARHHSSLGLPPVTQSRGIKQQTFLYPPGWAEGQPEASLQIQKAEGDALIALREALNNHPAFSGLNATLYLGQGIPVDPWEYIAVGSIKAEEHLPCKPLPWAWVGCTQSMRVNSINLNGGWLSKFNSSWGYLGVNADPLVGVVPWDKLSVLEELAFFNIGLQSVGGKLDGIGSLRALQNVTIHFNRFTGTIPDAISQLTNLQDLRAESNLLQGSLPSSMSVLANLQALTVGGNSIAGEYPSWIANLTNLELLDLSSNPIKGSLPESWSKLTSLTGLQLGLTEVNGAFPNVWSRMASLQRISLIQSKLLTTYPAALLAMTNLQSIRLTQNQLYGPIPGSIFTSQLTELSLENNYFNGTAPDPLKSNTSNDALQFRFTGNCLTNVSNVTVQKSADNCTAFYTQLYEGPPAPPSTAYVTGNSTTAIIVVSILVPLFAIIAMGLGTLWFLRTRRSSRISKLFTKGLRQTSREFTLSELKTATQNWGAAIGKGGYGTVYKAELKDGSFVAVKRLDQVSKQGDVEFIREVELLSRVHHRHLVNLIGFCAERGERALVYEYMAMGSLYEHLHGESAKAYPLSWDSRCKIAIHVALGIEYLHYGADPPLIHRDIKSANILLSDDGYSKVADFGLCKEAPIGAAADGSEQLVPTATAVRGSFGYLDPEYVNTSILSEKSDVYSYGVVLLELISGHKSIHDWQPLAYWAEEYLADREKTPLMVDPALEGNFDLDELYALCDIARTCVQDQSVNRPTIRDVAKALVENLGHGLTSFTGSQQDSASIVTSSQTDASSMPSTTYTPSSADPPSNQFSYQNYSETLHWTPNASGQVDKNGNGVTVSTGTKGDRLPVPVPKRPDAQPQPEDDEEMGDE